MVADTQSDRTAIPLKIEGVIVGLVSVGPACDMSISFTNKSTESYLKELVLSSMTESLSIIVDYVGEAHSHTADSAEIGHLRLI